MCSCVVCAGGVEYMWLRGAGGCAGGGRAHQVDVSSRPLGLPLLRIRLLLRHHRQRGEHGESEEVGEDEDDVGLLTTAAAICCF